MTIHVARDLKLISIDALKPYERNSRTHSAEQIAQLVKSIQEFGFTNPILTDGQNGIIAGHGRLAAAKKLGLKQVPVIDLSHLTPAQKRAYVIADNKIAMNAGWDLEILASEIASLGGELDDFDSIGFSDQEISDLLAGIEEPDLAPAPDVKQPEQKQPPVQAETVVYPEVEPAPPSSDDVAAEHWKQMPEFKQEDKSGERHVIVHFMTAKDAEEFFRVIGQKDTGQTKSIWFPPQERMDTESKRYAVEE